MKAMTKYASSSSKSKLACTSPIPQPVHWFPSSHQRHALARSLCSALAANLSVYPSCVITVMKRITY